jgi:carbamoyltransferase
MVILGLNFGHDAGAAVIRDGQILCCIVRERLNRVKHAMTLDVATIQEALRSAGVAAADIDYCAITSTQSVELVLDDTSSIAVSLDSLPQQRQVKAPLVEQLRHQGIQPRDLLQVSLLRDMYDPDGHPWPGMTDRFARYYPEYASKHRSELKDIGWLDQYCEHPEWDCEATLPDLGAADFAFAVTGDGTRYGFHYPVSFRIDGCVVPAYFIHHHMAHAAAGYYTSGLDEAAILTHDGFVLRDSYQAGMFYYAKENAIFPVTPHYMHCGFLYESVANFLNLGVVGGEGKLMGLSAYGKPRYFDTDFVGNWNNERRRARGLPAYWEDYVQDWLRHCLDLAQQMGYEFSCLADRSRITETLNADIAASTQKLFEENMLLAVESLHKILRRLAVGTENLCLSGGTALNCPANTRIAGESRFKNVFVTPCCDDSGLALGAALGLYHNILDQPLFVPRNGVSHSSVPHSGVPDSVVSSINELTDNDVTTSSVAPYLGARIEKDSITDAIALFKNQVVAVPVGNAAEDAAHQLAANSIVAWYQGRSEVGPRALGHRSILAHPGHARNWQTVNLIKAREQWRPLAPAVLQSEAHRWFTGTPLPSPFMLFNALVQSNLIPAVTHVDGSARLQTVNHNCGRFHDLLQAFYRLTGLPVVLNTSFNGPGEPIVETPEDALRSFLNMSLDVLYLEDWKVLKKEQ